MRLFGLLPGFLLLTFTQGCADNGSRVKAEINESASLPDNLPFHPLQWGVITTAINKADSRMWTLYGNDAAVRYARSNAQNDYPVGAVLGLVMWTQRDDDRWFGARIPERVQSVEFLAVGAGADHRPSYTYQKFEGSSLQKAATIEGLVPNEREAYILSQRAAVMP